MYPIPEKALAQHIAILGKTGSGKTTAAKAAAERILDDGGRVCVVDPTAAWWGMKSSATGKSAGYPFVIFGGLHADFPLGAIHGEAIAEIVGTSSTPAIIDTSQLRVSERTRFFADFADAIMRKNRGPLHLIIDEAHVFMPQGKVPDPRAGEMLAAGNNLVSGGRSRGLRIMLITQRPAKLHKDSLTQVETLVAMRLIAPQDRKAVEEWIKDNADAAKGREIIESLATLKTGHGWVWAPELGLLERVTFPRIRTFDSSAAPTNETDDSGPVLAAIDRDVITERLKTHAAEVLANDPAELKKRIRELERQVAADAKTRSTHTDEDIKAAEKRGGELGVKVGALRTLTQIETTVQQAFSAIGKVCAEQQGIIKSMAASLADSVGKMPHAPTFRHLETATPARIAIKHSAPPANLRKSASSSNGSGLPAPQQKILDQLAWLESKGIAPAPKETLAAVCGVSPTSGGYFNNLGKLRSSGLIEYPQAGTVGFTKEGRDRANLEEDDGRPVHEHWLEVVSEPQRKILAALIDAHPGEMDKDELANLIGVSPTSGGYFNNLGRLRTLGAVDYPSPGKVGLTRHVMP